jgi:hypothetical protein
MGFGVGGGFSVAILTNFAADWDSRDTLMGEDGIDFGGGGSLLWGIDDEIGLGGFGGGYADCRMDGGLAWGGVR